MAQNVEAQGGNGGNQWADGTTPLTPATSSKQPAEGGLGGEVWDDGVHDGVRKVYVGQGQDGISFINVVYKKGSDDVQGGKHGKKSVLGVETFKVDSNDDIVAVKVTYDKIFGQESGIITSVTFYTFKGKVSPPYGLVTESNFTLKDKNGGRLVGFHGRAGEVLHALGAYFSGPKHVATPTIPLAPAEKLPAVGGDSGAAWDDGAYGSIKKVYIGQAHDGISAVKFVYDKGAGEHGKSTALGFEEFVLDYPSEYITAVEGTYDRIFGSDAALINMLRFKTNKRTSPPFGLEAGTPFKLKKDGYKIVGFHGKVGDLLHQIGVYVLPITN